MKVIQKRMDFNEIEDAYLKYKRWIYSALNPLKRRMERFMGKKHLQKAFGNNECLN